MSYIVQNKQDFEQELEEAGNKLVVIDFYANWCGPCQIIHPKLEELSLKYANKAKVLKVNVDDCDEIAMEYNITSMPTFVFIKDQQIVDVCVGSNTENLVNKIERLIGDESLIQKEIKNSVTSEQNNVHDDGLDGQLMLEDLQDENDIQNEYISDDEQPADLQDDPLEMLEVVVSEDYL